MSVLDRSWEKRPKLGESTKGTWMGCVDKFVDYNDVETELIEGLGDWVDEEDWLRKTKWNVGVYTYWEEVKGYAIARPWSHHIHESWIWATRMVSNLKA